MPECRMIVTWKEADEGFCLLQLSDAYSPRCEKSGLFLSAPICSQRAQTGAPFVAHLPVELRCRVGPRMVAQQYP